MSLVRNLLICFLIFSISVNSAETMKIESKADKQATFEKNINVLIKQSKEPSDLENEFFPLFKQHLEEQGFVVVESYSKADKVIEFVYKGNMVFEKFKTTRNVVIKKDKVVPTSPAQTAKIDETPAQTLFHVKMYNLHPENKRVEKKIWDIMVSGPNTIINKDPSFAFKSLMEQYGKNKEIEKKFPKKKKSK